jgi:hypothetical protein
MAKADPTLPKRISLGWLVCGGMALRALLLPFAVYVAVGVYDAFYGSCTLSAEDRFGCALRQFVIMAFSIIPPVAGSDLSLLIGSAAGGTRRIRDQ